MLLPAWLERSFGSSSVRGGGATGRQIELADIERVEFELVQPGRHRERSILRVSSGGHVYKVTQDPEPPGDLAARPVRQVFDQLARRLPPHAVRDSAE